MAANYSFDHLEGERIRDTFIFNKKNCGIHREFLKETVEPQRALQVAKKLKKVFLTKKLYKVAQATWFYHIYSIFIKIQRSIRDHREPIEHLVLAKTVIINQDITNQEQIRTSVVIAKFSAIKIISHAARRITKFAEMNWKMWHFARVCRKSLKHQSNSFTNKRTTNY